MTLERIAQNGIVGAGGAGFPADVKLNAQPEFIILNGAECEPLLHKDEELMRNHTADVIRGMQTAMTITGAQKGIVGIKGKHREIIQKLRDTVPPEIDITEIGDFYPAGDEITLIYATTGRIVQPGQLPLSTGCVVQNPETLYNIAREKPVTEKFLTVAGAVKNPRTIKVPVGARYSDILSHFEITTRNYVIRTNGLMMGRLDTSLDIPVTKTTGGIIVLPADHYCVRMYERYINPQNTVRIAKAGCDQCSFCTELCPRYLLGHPVRPETAMRNRMFAPKGTDPVFAGNLYCCECNLCTFYACPESLDPKGATVIEKRILAGRKEKWEGKPVTAHPMADFRRVPTKKLMQRLDVTGFEDHAPLSDLRLDVARVTLPLKQHAGKPALAVVSENQDVAAGEQVAERDGLISANIHSPVSGTVRRVTDNELIIERHA